MEKSYKILNSHILKLDPVFLLSQECLMNYLLSSKKDSNRNVKTMRELYGFADIPLILVNSKNTIVQFSKPILDLFGRRDDQLVEHPLQTLFKDEHIVILHNIRNRIAGKNSIVGINSNDQIFNVEVNITPLRSSVLLEFKLIDEILDFEELIQVHTDLFNEIIMTSYPAFMIHQIYLFHPSIYQRTFSRFTFLLMITDVQSGDSESYIDSMKQYFTNSSVLSFNSSLWCSIFVSDTFMIESIKCYQHFALGDDKKAGIILDGYELPVLFYNLPDNFDWTDVESLITSVPPHISIEPIFKLYEYYQYINYLVAGHLIVPRSMVRYFEDVSITEIVDDLAMIENSDVANVNFFEPSIQRFSHFISYQNI